MEISNSYPAAYTGGNPPPRPDVEVRGGGRYEPPPSSQSLEYGDPRRRQPTEQVLEGELLNERRQGDRRSSEEELRQEQQRHYEQVQQVKSASASPRAAKALEEYLTNATLNGFSFSEYPRQLDVYV